MSNLIHPLILYGMIILGGVGVCLALPRRSVAPQVAGALVAALAMGVVLVVMGLTSWGNHPNLYFYVFSLVGLGSALRVITHPRPVYAALYFILTVIATSGLFIVLSAEFMAFALIIVYAGAILITYLFVIMLATQAPEESEVEVFAEYDVKAREPVAATVAGFLLLAVLTTLMFRGVENLQQPAPRDPDALIAQVPRKIERMLRSTEVPVASPDGGAPRMTSLMAKDETLLLGDDGNAALADDGSIMIINPATGQTRALPRDQWPADLRMGNVEELGFNLLRDHPGTIEIAGVILLMAMLGAVVLSRKQVELDEDAKGRQSRLLAGSELAEGVSGSANSPAGAAGGCGLMNMLNFDPMLTLAQTAYPSMMSGPTLAHYLVVSAVMFTLGVVGFVTRRNLIVMFLCTELMFQAAGLALVAFGRFHLDFTGQTFVIFVLTIAAAEAAMGLALVVLLFRRKESLDAEEWTEMKG